MRKLFTLKKDNKVKKGFTILELLVVVAIIAILAVIATPQFLGAIDKSRVSAEIADVTGIGQAVTMYNFDTSAFPLSVTGTVGTPGGSITGSATALNVLLANQNGDGTALPLNAAAVVGWNGPYMTTYPNVNRWGGALTYTTTSTVAGLTTSNVCLKLPAIPAADAIALKQGIDSVAATALVHAAPTGNQITGQLRIDTTTSATTPDVYYVIH